MKALKCISQICVIKGDIGTKKTILKTLGKRIRVFDGQIKIEPCEWLIPIRDNYPIIEKQFLRLEPNKKLAYSGVSSIPESISSSWLGTVDKVRTSLLSLSGYVFIPELNF